MRSQLDKDRIAALEKELEEAQQFKETWREGCNEDLQKENDRLRELLAVVKERRETLRDAVREFVDVIEKDDTEMAKYVQIRDLMPPEYDKLVSLVED